MTSSLQLNMISLEEYLDKCIVKNLIRVEEKDKALSLWYKIQEFTSGRLMEPDAAPCGDNGLMLAWDYQGRHIEFEIYPNLPTEVFYFDRSTESIWETLVDDTSVLSPELIDKIKLFES